MTSPFTQVRFLNSFIESASRCFLSAAAIFALGSIALPSSGQAALLSYESFDYTAGNLVGQNGGTGFSGAWSAFNGANGTTVVQAAGLEYSSLETDGGKAYITPTGGSSTGALRNLDATYSSGTVYLSFLTNLDDGARFFGLSLYDGGTERLLIGKQGGQTSWSLSGPVVTAQTSGTVTLDTTFLMVLRVDFDASGANERLRLYIDPTLGVEPAVAQIDLLTSTSFQFNALRIAAGFTSGPQAAAIGSFDEIRVGTTYADVTPVPEPHVAALLGVALVGVAFSRRKRLRN